MLLPYKKHLSSKRIVLASSSPRRKYALQELGLEFSIVPSTFAEDLDKSKYSNPSEYVSETATLKALEVYNRLKSEQAVPDILISADSIVVLEGKILEKPISKEHAIQMLTDMSGKTHSVITAVVILTPASNSSHCTIRFFEETFVTFSPLTPEMIEAYVETGTPMDKAGGYGIQEVIGGSFVQKIEGDYYNVTGFPVNRFCVELIKHLGGSIK